MNNTDYCKTPLAEYAKTQRVFVLKIRSLELDGLNYALRPCDLSERTSLN